jgi:hypothetical protein
MGLYPTLDAWYQAFNVQPGDKMSERTALSLQQAHLPHPFNQGAALFLDCEGSAQPAR